MKKFILFLMLSLLILGCKEKNNIPPVQNFELKKYEGTWYEIARLPNKFEKDLINVTANYTFKKNFVEVLNQGTDKNTQKVKQAKGKAKFKGNTDEGNLKVSFFGPFYGTYKIIDLDYQNYQYAIVTSNGYDFLWILARESKLEEELLTNLLEKINNWGYDTQKLIYPQQ